MWKDWTIVNYLWTSLIKFDISRWKDISVREVISGQISISGQKAITNYTKLSLSKKPFLAVKPFWPRSHFLVKNHFWPTLYTLLVLKNTSKLLNAHECIFLWCCLVNIHWLLLILNMRQTLFSKSRFKSMLNHLKLAINLAPDTI